MASVTNECELQATRRTMARTTRSRSRSTECASGERQLSFWWLWCLTIIIMMALVIMVIDNYYYDGFSDHHCERQLSLWWLWWSSWWLKIIIWMALVIMAIDNYYYDGFGDHNGEYVTFLIILSWFLWSRAFISGTFPHSRTAPTSLRTEPVEDKTPENPNPDARKKLWKSRR